MPQYLYRFCELFSAIGAGTPEDPGGDFSMDCWIDAPDAHSALDWGYMLLGDYFQKRFAHTNAASLYQGLPIHDGEIETDDQIIAKFRQNYDLPQCRAGEIPHWVAPWRISNLARK